MTPEDEAKILQDSAAGWKRANISRVKAEMERYGITVADLGGGDEFPELAADERKPRRVGPMLNANSASLIFEYLPATGKLIRKSTGRPAEWHTRLGYMHVTHQGRSYIAHRVVWLLHHGEWPANEIDHINGCRADNRIENLRDVSVTENRQNKRRAYKNNKTGFMGVTRRHRKYHAHIRREGAQFHLGSFDTAEEAHAAYLDAKRRMHATCTI